jgi:predicted nucleotidyltransferase
MQTVTTRLSETLERLKKQLFCQYQGRLSSLILFGSQARKEASPESDIDVLVLLKGEVNPLVEIKKNSIWLADLCLETEALINCIYLSEEQFQIRNDPFLRQIKHEGIVM